MTFLVFCRAHIRNYAVLWSSDSKDETFSIVQHCWLSDKALFRPVTSWRNQSLKSCDYDFRCLYLVGRNHDPQFKSVPSLSFLHFKVVFAPTWYCDIWVFESPVDITENSGRQDQVRNLSKTFKFCVKSLVLCCVCDCVSCNLVVI